MSLRCLLFRCAAPETETNTTSHVYDDVFGLDMTRAPDCPNPLALLGARGGPMRSDVPPGPPANRNAPAGGLFGRKG